jgi:hypothetical protein
MPPSEPELQSATAEESRERDARGAAILGWFHLALALPVLVGTVYAELTIDRVLNVASGVVLTLVGAGLLWGARRLARLPRKAPPA